MSASTMPPDRSHIRTEHRHPGSAELDCMPVLGIIELMADDHRVVSRAIREAAESLADFIEGLVPRLRHGGRLVYVGAGTSGRLGVLDAAECPPTFQSDPSQVVGLIAGGDSSLRRSSEGREDEPDGASPQLTELNLGTTDTVLGIAAGGTTPYVLGAIALAKRMGAVTGLLTCAPVAAIPRDCDHLIVLDTGPEVITGSTRLKAGSATKLALNIITTATFTMLGKVHGNLMVDLRATNAKLSDRAMRILVELSPGLSREAARDLLASAAGELKVAVVMHHRQVDAETARAVLAAHAGSLRGALALHAEM